MIKRQFCFYISLLLAVQLPAQRVVFNPAICQVSINIKNPERKEFVIEINPISFNPISSKPVQKKVVLNKANSSVSNILLKGPTMIKIMGIWNDSSLDYLVLPGTDFKLHLDANDRSFVEYEGRWKKENDFFNSMVDDAEARLRAIVQNEPVAFLKNWKKQYEYNFSLVQQAKADGISVQYADWVLQNIHTLYYSELTKQFTNYIFINEIWPVNTDEYINSCEILSLTQLNNASYFTAAYDHDFVAGYYLFLSATQHYQKNKLIVPSLEILYVDALEKTKKITATRTKKIMLQYLVESSVKFSNDATYLTWLQNFLKGGPGFSYYNELVENQLQLLTIAAKGKPALPFVAEDINGKLFSNTEYKGKYIYVDVWATWCIPCLFQMPYLERMKEKYKEKPIAFVSISTDKSKTVWQNFLAGNEVEPDQFISNPVLENSIGNLYRIKYIPRFVLIDPEGNILYANCYSPADPAMDMLLEKLIN